MGPIKSNNPAPSVTPAPAGPSTDGGSKRREYYAYVEEKTTGGERPVQFTEWLQGKR
jgi:hypothetical protein